MAEVAIQTDNFGRGAVQLDGVEIGQLVSGITVTVDAGKLTSAVINIRMLAVNIKTDCAVEINGQLVTDEIGRAIYESLKERYDDGI